MASRPVHVPGLSSSPSTPMSREALPVQTVQHLMPAQVAPVSQVHLPPQVAIVPQTVPVMMHQSTRLPSVQKPLLVGLPQPTFVPSELKPSSKVGAQLITKQVQPRAVTHETVPQQLPEKIVPTNPSNAARTSFARPRSTINSGPAKTANPTVVTAPTALPNETSTPLPPTTELIETSPMASQYWNRLHSLLLAAHSTLSILKPTPAALAQKADKGIYGLVATEVQGQTFASVNSIHSSATAEWQAAYSTGGLGSFTSYGVHHTSAAWVSVRLAQVVHARAMPTKPCEVLSDNDAAADSAIEDVRVRVWESELATLPVSFVEALVAARRRMRRIKNRIELCVKILAALEGRGRKMTDASLDKAKLALEKADLAAKAEEDRLQAARQARQEKERKAAERAEKKSGKLQKELERKKKRKQTSAAANFMMRFVKQKVEPKSGVDPRRAEVEEEGPAEDVDRIDSKCRALPLASNRDVVSVSWWLMAEMEGKSMEELDRDFKVKSCSNVGAPERSITTADSHVHLQNCAKRRKAAEETVNDSLRTYRRRRKTCTDDRTPVFVPKRVEVRGRGKGGPVKLLHFQEDHRPAFYGTCRRRAKVVGPRRPFRMEEDLDYSYDSGEEWEDDDGEDILDMEADKERASEEAELRRLYGSDDEEDDDDFLDDGDVEEDDDGDESDDAEMGSKDGGNAVGDESKESTVAGMVVVGPSKAVVSDPGIIDLTTGNGEVRKMGESPKRKALREDQKDLRKRQRRNRKLKQSVVIHGVSLPSSEEPSPLDRYAVTALDDAPTILMFNPYITHVSAFLQETSPPKPTPARIPRTSLDDGAKLDLAIVMVHSKSRTSRDSLVYEFCERRRSLGLPIPAKSEVIRAIRVMGSHEKRKGDTRPAWYLRDNELAAKLSQAKESAIDLPRGGVTNQSSAQVANYCTGGFVAGSEQAAAQ